MSAFLHYVQICAPMFSVIGLGWVLQRLLKWPNKVNIWLARFVFSAALPALLFVMMCGLSQLPPVDSRALIAFFGSCLIVFVIGRLLAWRVFRLDGVSQSVFALAGIFSNNAMLGIPLARIALGEAALPTVALVLVFNSLTLWTLVTVSVEWAKHGSPTPKGFGKTLVSVLKNPLIIGILSGTAIGLSGWTLPDMVLTPLRWLGELAAPLALFSLGLSLAGHRLREQWKITTAMTALKLLLQPLVVWLIAVWLGLPEMETRAVVLLGSIAVGANVYLMSRQFKVLEAPVASSLVLSTALSSLTTPLILALTRGA
ncbi:AEC family transporter [Aquabacterium sp. A3]|uniref:AEC family transporter n=1 Tax=Aquabacterium sp. A3 TaxID=3132829 RepID=UPI00311956B7